MKILGIDNGYSFTKDSDGHIFKSSYANSQMLSSSTKLTINGKTYHVGTGATTCDVDKIESEMNMVTTLACLCKCQENEFKLVLGLPIGQYNEQKVRFREKVIDYCKLNVEYANKQRRFSINDVIVAPQGASILYYAGIQSDCVIVDVGGLTIDVAQIDFEYSSPKIVKSNTYYKGMRTLYSSIIEIVNMRYNLRMNVEDADKIIRNGLIYKGERQPLDFLQSTLTDYITPIYEELKLNYNTNAYPIILCGGGANFLYRAMCKRFGKVILIDNCQFANAIGYYHLGIKTWGRE